MTILFISIIALVLTFLLYRQNLVSALTRVFTILVLAGMITNFNIRIKTKDQRSTIALIDISMSTMPFVDRAQKILNQLYPQPDKFYFAESVYQNLPDPAINGKATNIIKALRSTAARDPSSILLISDGNHNYGAASISDIENINVPVYCYSIGLDNVKDQEIIQVIHPWYAYPGDSISVEVIINSQGFDINEKSRLTMFAFDREFHRELILSNSPAQQSILFNLPVKAAGEYNLTFDLSLKPGEVNNSNNEYQTVIKVLAERIKVLYYTEHLSFTSRFLLPVLESDEQIDLTAVIKLSDHRYFDPVNNKSRSVLPVLNNYDVCIFDNINATRLPWHNISEILNQGTGIIVMGLIESPNETLIKILPIKISNAVIASIKPIQINAHFFKWNPGDELPPFQAINRVNGVQEKAFLIANTEQIPVIAYMPVGPSIVFQINGANPGVLHFLEQGIKQKNFFSDLIPDIIRFVAPTGRNRRLVLSSRNISYRVGEPINFDLQSFDRDFRLAAGGDFYLKQNDERIPFYESSPGNYQAAFVADHSGKLTFQAQGLLKEETMTSDPIELHIVMNTGESIEPINHLLLETIASQTGGEYHPIDRLKDLSIGSIDRPRIQRLGLDHPLYYFLIFVFLAIEWFLRRRRGTV